MPSPSLSLLRTQSDDRLVALAGAGHERAFEAIVERYRRLLLRAARRVLPESRAEDALQQALIAAWSALQRGDEVRDLRAWLYRIVHNTALNALRGSGYDYDELEDTLRITDAGTTSSSAARSSARRSRASPRSPIASAKRCCAPRSAATARRRWRATSGSPTTRCASSSTVRASTCAPRPLP
jgi:RNA polymerase sigma factor (sigma-70 family)